LKDPYIKGGWKAVLELKLRRGLKEQQLQ